MLHKTAPAMIKAAGPDDGLGEGQFRALVSVFGNKDSYGDVVLPGAFTDTLAEWAKSGNPVPVFWSHRMDDPDMCVGECVELKQTDRGLEVLGQIDLDDDARKARQVYRLLKGRRVTQFSFAYDVIEGAFVDTEDDWFYELRKLALYEVGPTPIGANQETELIAVKTASERAARLVVGIKAGRVLSAKNETALQDAHTQLSAAADQIAEVLAQVASEPTTDDEKAKASGPAKDETPSGKSEEPTRPTPVNESTLQTIQFADAS